jgi:hypothetical protein
MHVVSRLPEHPAPFTLFRLKRKLIRIGRNAVGHHIVRLRLGTFASLKRAADPYPPTRFCVWSIPHGPFDYDGPRKLRGNADGPGLIIVDADGNIVPPGLLIAEAERLACARRLAWEKKREERFRNGPAEGVWRRHANQRYFRSPKTHGEIREMQDDDVDGFRIKTRACRRNLVDAYDDPSFARQPCRGWKRYRKTQWKKRKDN